ncbi:hypothetical protein [Micromonospora sp. NPDC049891]|uniref:hypothetical protein n=1 Tax=Micromonospora sp. NPDC049891 TaxID=3155655 RepID=UPI00340E4EF6
MIADTVIEFDFSGLTVRDERGAHLTIERTSDGRVSAWIARPGTSDGYSVVLDDADRQQVARFLDVQPAGARSWLAVSEPDINRVRGGKTGRVWQRTERWGKSKWESDLDTGLPREWHELLADEGTLHEVDGSVA